LSQAQGILLARCTIVAVLALGTSAALATGSFLDHEHPC
jgi:hypothetical protein